MAETERQHDGADTGQFSQGDDSSTAENKGDRKRLKENFISLSVLQGAHYILPLITVPWLRVHYLMLPGDEWRKARRRESP